MSPIEIVFDKFASERFPLPTEQQLNALETRIGVTFPDDYREFLLNFNGAYFSDPQIIPPDAACPSDGLESMFGIGATHPTVELGRVSDLVLFQDNDPPQIVPIGETCCGHLIILITHPEERGSILLKQASGDFFYLADGIEEFFSLLREPIDD